MGDDILAAVRRGFDFTTRVSEPSCLPPLADLGGEVNRLEPPRSGYIRTAA